MDRCRGDKAHERFREEQQTPFNREETDRGKGLTPARAEQRLIRQCRINEPTARVVGELAGIQAASRSTDEIVQTALAALALLKQGTRP